MLTKLLDKLMPSRRWRREQQAELAYIHRLMDEGMPPHMAEHLWFRRFSAAESASQ